MLAHRVYLGDRILAFLDLHPIRAGHVLVIPKAHHVWFEGLPEDQETRLTSRAQRLAKRMKSIYGVKRVAPSLSPVYRCCGALSGAHRRRLSMPSMVMFRLSIGVSRPGRATRPARITVKRYSANSGFGDSSSGDLADMPKALATPSP
ncbi:MULTISPECIES: HIT family protein [Alphaproteobacteria]|uniref:HIT family protein n=1 Tax=Alphaproteobacteria TaxID=28211 RepID=UPI001F2FC695|nr:MULTISPECIES: HIT domain-containing protein [Alphaproteobacteria]MDD9737938.1 HIT domain-containing protein [Seohaeicola sp. SP36]